MKKMIKKIAAAFMAMALVAVGMVAMNKTEAKAAQNVKLYFNTTDPTNYGANVWGGANVTGGANVPTWADKGGQPSLVVDSDKQGWAYITVDDSSKIEGLQIVKSGSALKNSDGSDIIWNAEIASQNLTEAYFDTVSGKWYKEASLTNEILPPVLDNIFYVTGEETLTGSDWGATPATGLMTETSAGVFEKTFTNIAAGTYNFKVLQDPADFAWKKVVWNDSYYPGTGENMTITVDALSDVTFKVTVGNTNTLTVTVTPVSAGEEETTTAAKEDEKETTTAAKEDEKETTTAAKEDEKETTTAAKEDEKETTTAAKEDEKETTTAAKDDENTTTTVADDENGNGAGGGTGSGSVDDTPAGDSSMVAIFAILAVLAAAGVVTVVVAKRRAIEE